MARIRIKKIMPEVFCVRQRNLNNEYHDVHPNWGTFKKMRKAKQHLLQLEREKRNKEKVK